VWIAIILAASTGLFSSSGTGGVIEGLFALVGIDLSPVVAAMLNFIARKSAHVIAYGTLGWLALRAMAGGRGGWVWRWAWMALAIAVVVASIDEFHQSTVPTRTGSVWDVVLDVAAATLVIAALGGRKSRVLSFLSP
jgi:VanZ family protein